MGVYAPLDYVIYLGILLLVYYFFLKVVFSRIKLDRNFLLTSSPYILAGIFLRVLADTPSLTASKWWSITPGVYILTIAIGLLSLAIGMKIDRERYWVFPFCVGCLYALLLLFNLLPYFKYPQRIFSPLLLTSFITFSVYIFSQWKGFIFQKIENWAVLFAHVLDGCATFLANELYGFGEEHLLPRFLIDLTGTGFVMVPLKLFLVLGAIYVIDQYAEKKERKLLKFLVFVLGIGPGLRNTILPSLL